MFRDAAAGSGSGEGKEAEGKEGDGMGDAAAAGGGGGLDGQGSSSSSSQLLMGGGSSASAVPLSQQLEAAFRDGGDSDEEAAQRKRVTRPKEFSFMARQRGRPATPGAGAGGVAAASPGGGRVRSSSRRGSKDSFASSKGRTDGDGDAAEGAGYGAGGAGGNGNGELQAHVSIAGRRAEEERKAREAEIESHLSYRFRAMEVPEAVRLPMFALLAEKAEARRRAEHEARAAELAASAKPFQQLMEHEEAMRARAAARRARLELSQARELNEGRRFKAVPIPATTTAPDGEYMKLLARERERPLRVMSAARALAASASLPPRMALAQEAERRRQAERDASQRAAEAAERRLARFRAGTAPDFNALHEDLENTMREGRRTFAATTPAPFAFDSTERQAAEAARREARQREFELATSPSMALRALSASAREGAMGGLGGGRARSASRGRPLSATAGSGFAPGASGGSLVLDRSTASARGRSAGARPASAGGALGTGLDGSMSMSVGGGGGGLGGLGGSMSLHMHGAPPPAAMTRTVQLRMLDVQRRVRERQAEERAAAIEAEERAARTRAATKALAPVVQRLEAERNPVPLAWQGDPTGGTANAATLAKMRFEATARSNMEEQRRRVEAAQAARPLLMLRGTLETRREEARRAALVDAARRIGEPGDVSWQQVAAGSGGLAPSGRSARSRSAGARSAGARSAGPNRHDDEGHGDDHDDEFADLGDDGEDGSALFDAEERELLSLLARQKAAAQAAGAGGSTSLASSKGGRR